MRKILFFIETLGGGGAEKVLCDLVNHMDQSKFEITVQTLWPSENRTMLAEGIRYRSVYPAYSRLANDRMRLEGALGQIYRLRMKDKYDIEVAYLECGATKILSSSTNRHAAKIAWVHSDLAVKMAGVLDVFVKKTAPQYRKFDEIVCVSEDSRKSFNALFGEALPVSVLYNTLDDQTVRARSELPLPAAAVKRRTTLVSAGRLSAEKAYDRLLRVHKRLLEEGMEHDLWIVGEGGERPALERYVKENGLEDSVRLFGFQSNPYPFFRAADLLVCSSHYEGFSTFITEGLILGKPIVTTACAGMRELLGNSEYGLITGNDEESLCEGIKGCLADPALRRRFAEAALRRGADFSAEELTRKTEAFLEEAFQHRRRQKKA